MRRCFIAIITVILVLASVFVAPVLAHSGKTDSKGGHWDYSTNTYHYHCGGHPAHQHTGGICPYSGSSSKPTVSIGTNPFPTPSTSYNQEENQESKSPAYGILAVIFGIFAIICWVKTNEEEKKGNLTYWGNLGFFATIGAIILAAVAIFN